MRFFGILLCFISICGPGLTPSAASADCRQEIAALYDGPLDPFQRPAHRQKVMIHDAEGVLTRVMDNVIETPLRTISGEVAAGHFTLVVDRDYWTGPTQEGPWTLQAAQFPEGREAAMRAVYAQEQANLSEADCRGADAAGRMVYAYRTQTDPDASGKVTGTHYTLWIDPTLGQVVQFEMTDFVTPWAEGVSKERHVIEVEFDPAIRVARPD